MTNGIAESAMRLFSLNMEFKTKDYKKMQDKSDWTVYLIDADGNEEIIIVDNKTMLFRIRSREYISRNEKFFMLDRWNKIEKLAYYIESVSNIRKQYD